jgi:RNA polymerase sigma factor (sigma-70 family)
MSTTCTRELIERSLAGDRSAFEDLVAPLVEPAYRLACGMLLDRDEAEDAVQEATLKAWLKLGSFRTDADPRPWFLTIVANHCRDLRRSRWWSVLRGVDTERSRAEAPPEDLAGGLDLRRALAGLPVPERALLVLHYYLDLPLEEVARVLGVSPAAAKSRLYRVLRRLRGHLEACEAGT